MEAFESDDDFGDLYTDVEAQASSAIDGVPVSTPFRNDSLIVDAIGRNEKPSSDEENEVDDCYGSESEDDLNIVLNDEDCKSNSTPVIGDEDREDKNDDLEGFIVTNDDKCIKTCGPSNPRDANVNSSASIEATGEWRYQNDRGQYKEPQNLGTTQRRCFKLPWYRSILDVNIDAFEEKPWRSSGADITDYFNFGLNEDGWKNYCNSVDQLRLSALVPFGNRNNVSRNQAYEAGPVYSEHLEDPTLDNDCRPNGRAIQVEDGDRERQPTTVAKRPPRDRDTDVVIEINLEKPAGNTSDTYGKQNHSSSETSDCTGGTGNEFSVGFTEGKDERPFRCSPKKTLSSPMPEYSSSDEVELAEAANKSTESNVPKQNVCCSSEAEPELLLLEEEDQLNLFSSCFESDSEASGDSSSLDCGNSVSLAKRSSVNSGHNLWEHDSSQRKNSKGNNGKVKPVDPREFSRSRSPDCDERRKNNLSAKFGRHKEKFRDFSYYKDSELFCGSGRRESAENRWHIAPRSCGKAVRGFRRDCNSYPEEDRNERRNLCEDERVKRHRPSMKPVAYIETEHHFISRYTHAREEFDSQSNRNYNRVRFRNSEDHNAQCRDRDLFIRERDRFDRSYDAQFLERGKRFRDENRGTTDISFMSHQLYRDHNGLEENEYCENLDSFQRSYEHCDETWTDTMSLMNGVPNLRFVERGLQKVCSRESGDTFSETVHFDRKMGFARRSEALPWTNEEMVVGIENPTFSKNHWRLRRDRDSTHDKLRIDNMHLDQLGYKRLRRDETDRRSIRRSDSDDCRVRKEQAFVPCGDTMELSVGEGKLSGRCREVGDSKVNSKLNHQHHDVFDIEEGQIVSEDCKRYRQRIMESLEKMEKRRERFEKQPIINVERGNCLKTDEIFVETPQPNRDRPARKRRWC